jgi:DNA-binding transcriptional LysR family regulator
VTGAAARLHLTQPAISRALASLEEEVGFKLFVRVGNRLVPTPQGEAFFRSSENILSQIQELSRAAKDIADNRGTRFRLAVMPQVARGLAPLVVSQFGDKHPAITVSMDIRYRREAVRWDALREFDIALLKLPIETPLASINVSNVITVKFADLSAVVLLPKNHPAAKAKEVSVTDLANRPFITFDRASAVRLEIDELFRQANVEPHIKAETSSGIVSCELVERGMGASIVDAFSAMMADPTKVVAKPLKEQLVISYGFGFPIDYRPSELSISFCEITCQVVTDLLKQYPFMKGRVFSSSTVKSRRPIAPRHISAADAG